MTSTDSSEPKISTLMDDLRMEPEKVNIRAKVCYILSSVRLPSYKYTFTLFYFDRLKMAQ